MVRLCFDGGTRLFVFLGYRGRVALADYPQGGLFVVTLSQLSPEDVGRYRCGLGNRNNMFFFGMNLTVSAGTAGGWWVKFAKGNAVVGEVREQINRSKRALSLREKLGMKQGL